MESYPVLNELHFSGQILLTKNKICLDPSPHYSARPIRFDSRDPSDRLVFFDLRVLMRNPVWKLHVILDGGKVQL